MKIFGLNISRAKTHRTLSAENRSRVMSNRSYDAAATSRNNANHWLYADSRDADSIISQDLQTLRNRARYEARNDTYAEGIIDTLANDLVGTGPRLQLNTANPDFDKEVENKFPEWALECDFEEKDSLAELLWLAAGQQQCESGEAFIILQNRKSPTGRINSKPNIELKLHIVEPDRIATPMSMAGIEMTTGKIRYGIEYDDDGRAIFYYILKKHPGSSLAIGDFGQYDKVPAANVIHLCRYKRPGQSRGVPWITSALPLFAQLRRYTLATVASAEQVANMSGVMTAAQSGDETDDIESMDEIEIPRNSLLTLPAGREITQIKPEQPTSTYAEFKHEIINEIARGVNMPFNIAAANSSKYNYASGRLDWQVYYRFISKTRQWIGRRLLNKIFYAWLQEASLVRGYFKTRVPEVVTPQWFWPGTEHVDPKKEAEGQEKRLKNKTTTYATEYARQGKDWEREFQQIAKEQALAEELGIELPDSVIEKNDNSNSEDDNNDNNNAE